jgi:antitoxin (DNA-binding transcriptional repressor) of toxin-antitoxin stability system
MKTLSIREMRTALTHLDELVAEEGEILLTRHGRAMARILPVKAQCRLPSHADLRARMPRMAAGSEVLVGKDRDSR